MENIFEMFTWSNSPQAQKANKIAIEEGKKHNGNKFTVAVGEWGVRTYLVLTETKEQAKEIAIEYHKIKYPTNDTNKIKVRDVTSAKKYQ